MKKFRALLLSMVMFTSVCPLYGFTPAKAVAEDGGDEPAVEVTPEEKVEKAIDSVDKATGIEIENVKALEQDALDNLAGSEEEEKPGVNDLLQDIYDLKNGAESDLKDAYDGVLDEGFKVLDAINKASQDNRDATFARWGADYWYGETKDAPNKRQAYKAAGKAEDAAADAKAAAKNAWEQVGNANDAVKAADGIIKEVEKAVDVEATNKAIDEKLDQAIGQAETAMLDTAKAAAEAKEVMDTLDSAANVADTLATAAKTNLGEAQLNFVGAIGNLLGSVLGVRNSAQDVAAKGVTADMVQNVENKVTDIEQTTPKAKQQSTINTEVNSKLFNARTAIRNLLGRAEEDDKDTLGYKVLSQMNVGLSRPHVTENNNFVATEGVTKANADLEEAKGALETSVKAVPTSVEAVRTAGQTLARNYIVNEITTAVKDLLDTADAQAKEDYKKADTAATDAAEAYVAVSALDKEDLHVDTSDLDAAKDLVADMGELADKTKDFAKSASRQARAAGKSAEKAEEAARKKRGRR